MEEKRLLAQIRVAIIDDHAVVGKVLRMTCDREHDLTVTAEAENRLAALEMTDEHRPDAVLMDINMPVTNGLDATRIVNDRPRSGRLGFRPWAERQKRTPVLLSLQLKPSP